jgi:hypothetical protein
MEISGKFPLLEEALTKIRNIRQIKEIHADRDIIVKNALDCCTIRDGQLIISGPSNISSLNYSNAIINFELMVTEGFEKRLEDLRYSLPFFNDYPLTNQWISEILKRLKDQGKNSFDDVIREMEAEFERIERESIKRFDIHVIINAMPEADFSSMSFPVDDAEVKIQLFDDLDTAVLTTQIIDMIEKESDEVGYPSPIENRLCLSISFISRNRHYAQKKGKDIQDFALSLIELANHKSIPLFKLGGSIDYSAPSNLGSVFSLIINEEEHVIYLQFNNEKLDASKTSINREDILTAIEKYMQATPEGQQILRYAFSAYHHGITEKRPGFAFIYFWTSIEIILGKRGDLRHLDMLNWLFRLLPDQSLIHEFELGQLLKIRNDLLHEAVYHRVGIFQANLIRMYSARLLDFFLFHLSDLTRSQIELFYSNYDCHKNEFKRKRASDESIVFDRIKMIRESRSMI